MPSQGIARPKHAILPPLKISLYLSQMGSWPNAGTSQFGLLEEVPWLEYALLAGANPPEGLGGGCIHILQV